MSVLDICWRCVRQRVLLGLWLVNQAEESVLPAARQVLRRMVEPAKALSAIGAPIAGLPIALTGQISPGTLRWTGSCNGLLESIPSARPRTSPVCLGTGKTTGAGGSTRQSCQLGKSMTIYK